MGGKTRRELERTHGWLMTPCSERRSVGLWRSNLETRSWAPSEKTLGNFKSTCKQNVLFIYSQHQHCVQQLHSLVFVRLSQRLVSNHHKPLWSFYRCLYGWQFQRAGCPPSTHSRGSQCTTGPPFRCGCGPQSSLGEGNPKSRTLYYAWKNTYINKVCRGSRDADGLKCLSNIKSHLRDGAWTDQPKSAIFSSPR